MLEEKDRRALEDLERRLHAEDPAFAARMAAGVARRPFPAVTLLCVTAFLSVPFVALFFGPTAALITADVAAVGVVAILTFRHRRRR